MKTKALFGLATAITMLAWPLPASNQTRDGITTFLHPNRSNATNGDTVWVSYKIANQSGQEIRDATLTFTFGREFRVLRSSPEGLLGDHAITVSIPTIKNNEALTFKVWARIEASDSSTGFPLEIGSIFKFDGKSFKDRCAIIMIPKNVYPDLIGELRETHRISGTIDYNLSIAGGYPPYEYYIDWGDKSSNRGGLREEGVSEVSHTYEMAGEYRINAYINDYLGKQVAIRKRIYIMPWSGE